MKLRKIFRSRDLSPGNEAEADAFFAWADDVPLSAPVRIGTGLTGTFLRIRSSLSMEEVTMDRARKDAIWQSLMTAGTTEPTATLQSSATRWRPRFFVHGMRDAGSPTLTPVRRGIVVGFNLLIVLALVLGTTRWVQNRHGSPPKLPAYMAALATATPRWGTPPPDAPIYGLVPDSGCLSESNTPVPSPWANIPDLQSALSTPISEYVSAVQRGPAPDDASLTYAPATLVVNQCGNLVVYAYASVRESFQRNGKIAPSQATSRYIWEHDNPYLTPAEKASLTEEQTAAIAQIIPAWNPVIARTEFDFDTIWNGRYSSIKEGTVYRLADGRYAAIIYERTGTTQVPGTTLITGGNALIPYFIAFVIQPIGGPDSGYLTISVDQLIPLCGTSGCPKDLASPKTINASTPVASPTPAATPEAPEPKATP